MSSLMTVKDNLKRYLRRTGQPTPPSYEELVDRVQKLERDNKQLKKVVISCLRSETRVIDMAVRQSEMLSVTQRSFIARRAISDRLLRYSTALASIGERQKRRLKLMAKKWDITLPGYYHD
ncbi:hypothetical protein BIZ78_gp144 [Erwinia phage vB_EamM_Caitlin]|uniref:hypothetical protein n=1 Tax=Erwinia phage vB_EamM_Caitlin TaxID=1883379 RepID=UPI00081C350A|nr:hypothetical protein BIZ78_gp144 [Erwinia phage vB_EamM_Caitlin]ANZ48431.1 hypothetical protein CAITLIN_136 [Erwinia phage vB_EamM_Caitlin]